MKHSIIALGAVLALTAVSAAGLALGVVLAVASERARALLGEVEWDEGE